MKLKACLKLIVEEFEVEYLALIYSWIGHMGIVAKNTCLREQKEIPSCMVSSLVESVGLYVKFGVR